MKSKKRILVTGSESQLGKTLRMFPQEDFEIDFQTKYSLDITDKKAVKNFFKNKSYDYCFNFAAYTNVNQAEEDKKKCFDVNVKGVANLAKKAKKYDFTLIHISTDYVFDGQQEEPYTESDKPNPLNVYGESKLMGEQIIQQYLDKYLIIRTSWLYSEYNNNFVKTILRLAQTKNKLKLIDDQVGAPTYAHDLIDFLLTAVRQIEGNRKVYYYGLYHFSNKGKASWYQFGKKILNYAGVEKPIKSIDTARFNAQVQRPAYSVLSKEKLEKTFDYEIRPWKTALKDFFKNYKNGTS